MCPLKGVGYYEFGLSKVLTSKELFRPQKGLLVINVFPYFLKEVVCCGFPSPTGVTYYELSSEELGLAYSFNKRFPSPTGVTYYESSNVERELLENINTFPSPPGVTYYELSM